jgi:hypothetical protein
MYMLDGNPGTVLYLGAIFPSTTAAGKTDESGDKRRVAFRMAIDEINNHTNPEILPNNCIEVIFRDSQRVSVYIFIT